MNQNGCNSGVSGNESGVGRNGSGVGRNGSGVGRNGSGVSSAKTAVWEYIESREDCLREVGRTLWEHPEIGMEEKFAHGFLTNLLEQEGFQVTRHHLSQTGFKATAGDSTGPHIALMCEYDALPALGHACGHNLIAEAAVGAALGLQHWLSHSGSGCGRVSLLGCPAEENMGGKLAFIEHGEFKDVDLAMMVHPRETDSLHMPHHGICELEVEFRGRNAHINGSPWEGRNAMDAASLAYQGFALLGKHTAPDNDVNCIIRTNSNTDSAGVVPSQCVVVVTIRSLEPAEMSALLVRVKDVCSGAAIMTGCSVQCEVFPEVYESLVSNRTALSLFRKNADQLCGKSLGQLKNVRRSGGSTDMGNVSRVVPAIHPVYQIGGGVTAPHTPAFADITGGVSAHEATICQAKLMAATALDLFYDRDLLDSIKRDFENHKTEGFIDHDYSELYGIL